MELSSVQMEKLAHLIRRSEQQLENIEKMECLLSHAHGELANELSSLRAELGLTGQPTLGLDAEPPPAVADLSRRSPAEADSAPEGADAAVQILGEVREIKLGVLGCHPVQVQAQRAARTPVARREAGRG